MNRRGFLQLLGASVALSAGGIAILEPEPIKTYFLPPQGGWAVTLPGAWELALAKDALDSIDAQLKRSGALISWDDDGSSKIIAYTQRSADRVGRLMDRKVALLAKIDYLAKGGHPKGVRILEDVGGRGPVRVHGGIGRFNHPPEWWDANVIRVKA